MTPTRMLFSSIVAATVVTVAACGGEQVAEHAPTVRPLKTVVVGGLLTGERVFPGTVQAAQRAELAFRVDGQLIARPVKNGDVVESGQVLARLDPRDYQLAVDEAQATFDKWDADLRRYRRLYENDAVPLSDLELRRSQRDVSNARLSNAKLNLDYTYLRAPFAGEIGETYVENREDVRAKEPVMSLHDVTAVEIDISVPEAYRAQFSRDDDFEGSVSIVARFEFAPGKEFDLQLKEFAASADRLTQTFKATFIMDQPEGVSVQPGMTAQVYVRATTTTEASPHDGFVVPARCVFNGDNGEALVWVVDESAMTVHQREVVVGEVTGTESIWVQSGLNPGDRIATVAVNHLREGMKVRLLDE